MIPTSNDVNLNDEKITKNCIEESISVLSCPTPAPFTENRNEQHRPIQTNMYFMYENMKNKISALDELLDNGVINEEERSRANI